MKGAKAEADRLRVYRVEDVPLREVSGICLRRGAGGTLQLIAISDRAAFVAWFDQPDDDMAPVRWQMADLRQLEGSRLPERDPQIEAVCADGAGRVLVLQESPSRAELVDPLARRVLASIELAAPGGDAVARSWVDADGSHGEGAVCLPDGHLLVAKEKDPPALIEFGPGGARPLGWRRGGALGPGEAWPVEPGDHRYVPLAVWQPDAALEAACRDFSDLEVGPDGHLYLLSDQSGSIARLADLAPSGGTATAPAVWRLRGLKGKPEGLAFTRSGRAIVALDTPKARENLALFDPPIAAP